MADELTLNQSARLDIDGINRLLLSNSLTVDVASSLMMQDVVSIGTVEEDLSFGDTATPRMFWIWNNDTTNYVRFGPKSGGAMVAIGRLPARVAGEEPLVVGPIRLDDSVVIRCLANTAACKVGFIVLSQ